MHLPHNIPNLVGWIFILINIYQFFIHLNVVKNKNASTKPALIYGETFKVSMLQP